MGSRGSVIPYFLQQARSGSLPITDPSMTRFNISLSEGVEMVLWALKNALGGELFVPKLPSYKITDVAEAIGPNCEKPVIGIRPGEKLHEEMITAADSFTTYDLDKYFVILPSDDDLKNLYANSGRLIKLVKPGFAYNSGTNTSFLDVEEIRALIKANVDPNFMPA